MKYDPRFCISYEFTDESDGAGLWTTLSKVLTCLISAVLLSQIQLEKFMVIKLSLPNKQNESLK